MYCQKIKPKHKMKAFLQNIQHCTPEFFEKHFEESNTLQLKLYWLAKSNFFMNKVVWGYC